MLHAFTTLTASLSKAPALGLPDHNKPFFLYCVVSGPAFAGILAQHHGGVLRPVAYLSKKLPLQVQGMPSCLQALAACAMVVKEASKITLGGPTTLYTTHSVVHLMQNMSTQHMTTQRTSGYEVILFNTQHLEIRSCSETTLQVRFLHSLLHLSVDDPTPQRDFTPTGLKGHPQP